VGLKDTEPSRKNKSSKLDEQNQKWVALVVASARETGTYKKKHWEERGGGLGTRQRERSKKSLWWMPDRKEEIEQVIRGKKKIMDSKETS